MLMDLLLSGKIDIIIESNMKPWDYMAQVALLKEVWRDNDRLEWR